MNYAAVTKVPKSLLNDIHFISTNTNYLAEDLLKAVGPSKKIVGPVAVRTAQIGTDFIYGNISIIAECNAYKAPRIAFKSKRPKAS